ncbi:hypothetical protein [Nannocystis pusilla]|uniref:hypothetical protein n=1 Tax=Nannocystis pusilla TaxID=889268 RepID=UPI003BF3D6B5
MSDKKSDVAEKEPKKCGLVMPISGMEGLSASHWQEVKALVIEALLPDWQVTLVSEGEDTGIIHRRIVERLYSDDIVVVDASARNPNVMFELGMRLAFDKPTVVIKDEETPYPFDVTMIEYVPYPRDLRYARIVSFKQALAAKVAATAKPEHQTFLKSFGPLRVAKLETREVTSDQLLLDRVGRLETHISRLVTLQERVAADRAADRAIDQILGNELAASAAHRDPAIRRFLHEHQLVEDRLRLAQGVFVGSKQSKDE